MCRPFSTSKHNGPYNVTLHHGLYQQIIRLTTSQFSVALVGMVTTPMKKKRRMPPLEYYLLLYNDHSYSLSQLLCLFDKKFQLGKTQKPKIKGNHSNLHSEMHVNDTTIGIYFLFTTCTISFVMANEKSREIFEMKQTAIKIAEDRVLSRQKRYLIFPEGSNVQLVYCLTIGAHARVGELVLGLTAALAWELPSKVDRKLTNLLHRQSRSVIYPKIEAFLQSAGLDGRSCVMKALCEAGQRDSLKIGSGTFIQELLHAIFKLQQDGTRFEVKGHLKYDYAHEAKENCATLYPTCQYSIYDLDF